LLDVGVLRNDGGKHAEASLVVVVHLRVCVDEVGGALDLNYSRGLLRSGGYQARLHLLRVVRSAARVANVGGSAARAAGAAALTLRGTITSIVAVVVELLREATLHCFLEQLEDLLDKLEGVRAAEQGQIKSPSLGFVHSLNAEVFFILFLHLNAPSDLGQLVVCHKELLVLLELEVVETDTCLLSLVGSLVADKCPSAHQAALFSRGLDQLD